jgi:hypothetical protein
VSSARASDTIKDGDMRLRSEARKLSRDDDAGETRDLRKDAASTVDQLPKPAPRAQSRRRPWLMMIVVALLAAGIAAGVVAFVMSRQTSSQATSAPPDAAEQDTWGIGSAGKDLREGLEEVRKAGEDLRKLRDQFHGSN